MHALELLHKRLRVGLPQMHRRRVRALFAGVAGLLRGEGLWLSEVGRHVPGPAGEKHRIKRVDRLLGNGHLHGERRAVYSWMARMLVGATRHPCIVVDWSDVGPDKKLYLLRAAVSVGGRAMTLYEEVHSRYHHRGDTRAFLTHLAEVLPPSCVPILVTDAGFRSPWFRAVAERGWFYVGRVRNRDYACWQGSEEWFPVKDLYAQGSGRPRALGPVKLPRYAPFETRAYLYRKGAKGRVHRTHSGRRRCAHNSRKYAERQREPWLLVSNLAPTRQVAKRVVGIYRDRMSIEEAFRDLKAHRHGFAFRSNLGRHPQRVATLLLIAALATLVLWLTGLVGIARGHDRLLQANTERRRRVLSVIFVGRRLRSTMCDLRKHELAEALAELNERIRCRAFETA